MLVYLDLPLEGREVEGELHLRVCELAAAGVGGVEAEHGRGPLEQVHTALLLQHAGGALVTEGGSVVWYHQSFI